MTTTAPQITGFWKFKSNRILREDGNWHQEVLFGGGMAFSERGETCLFVRTDQGAWGFSGQYTLAQNQIRVKVESAIAVDLEGKYLEREFEFTGPDEFIYRGLESHTGRRFETIFVRS